MTKLTITINGALKNPRGTARKDGVEYKMRELQTKWKLVGKLKVEKTLQVDWSWSKKDCPTFEDWCNVLSQDGFEILLAD